MNTKTANLSQSTVATHRTEDIQKTKPRFYSGTKTARRSLLKPCYVLDCKQTNGETVLEPVSGLIAVLHNGCPSTLKTNLKTLSS